MAALEVSAVDAARMVTVNVRITQTRQLRLRIAVAAGLLRLAALVGGFNANIEIANS